jgi:ADP-ribose pyrophosphatase
VGIVATTEQEEVLLVEQFRVPVECSVLELPAGLIADEDDETTLEAARRELLEETGYTAPIEAFSETVRGPSSAGLTDEVVEIVMATNVKKISEGGGVGDERIKVFVIPISQLHSWISERSAQGVMIDFKVRLITSLLSDGAMP